MSTRNDKPERREFATDEPRVFNELVLEKHANGFRLFVQPDEEDDKILVEDSNDEAEAFAAIVRVMKTADAREGERVVIVRKAEKLYELSVVAEKKANAPVAAEVHAGVSPDEHAAVERLFDELGGWSPHEPTLEEEQPIDADDEIRALVLPAGNRGKPRDDGGRLPRERRSLRQQRVSDVRSLYGGRRLRLRVQRLKPLGPLAHGRERGVCRDVSR